jgi:hypothetical protein
MIEGAIALAIKLILMWLGSSEKKKEAKRRFLIFVDSLDEFQLLSVKLNKSDTAQRDRIRKELNGQD